mgnify:FL=1
MGALFFLIFGVYEFFEGTKKAEKILSKLPFSISYRGVLVLEIIFFVVFAASYILLKKTYSLM